MSHSPQQVPLGAILQQAGLVSAQQVRTALEQQRNTLNSPRIGEILAKKGLVSSQTVDFFAEHWLNLIDEQPKQPIGQYFKQAALLSDQQIKIILQEQKQTKAKFGELAIAKGWLKRTTVNFFLRYLMADSLASPKILDRQLGKSKSQGQSSKPNVNENKDDQSQGQISSSLLLNNLSSQKSAAAKPNFSISNNQDLKNSTFGSTEHHEYSQKIHEGFLKIKQRLLKIEGHKTYSEKTLDRLLFWTGGQSFLTQKLLTLISENAQKLNGSPEEQQIDYLVQARIINNWDRELEIHFESIKSRLLHNQKYHPPELLVVYQKILTKSITANGSKLQQELLNMGLVVKQQQKLMVANEIYRSVFDFDWIAKALNYQTPQPNSDSIGATSVQYSKNSWSRFKNILLLLTIIGLLSVFVNNIVQRLAVRFAFHQGNELLKQKSFSQAMTQYNRLLNLDSNYFQAWTNRGYALAGLQKYEEMQQSCSTATIIEPTAVYAWNCRGEALHNLQRYTEAIAAFERAVSYNQTDPIFLINKSESLRALGRAEESVTVITEAITMLEKIEAARGKENISGEFAVALTVLGNGLRKQDQYSEAIKAYQRAISYSANYFPAHIGEGIALIRLQRYEEAQNKLELILVNLPLTEAQQAQTWLHLGKALCNSQDYAGGITAFERAIELKPDYQAAKLAKNRCS
ncbi:MAG: tetratricopeptide repeat protein [Cyanobacteria bacterium P01_A01_bin.83]